MRYTIIGGINGVGKSTVYSVLSEKEKADLGHRVNVDDIVADMGDWRDIRTQISAGKIAVSRIRDCLNSCESFHQETTLSGRNIIRTATDAKNRDFYVCLWYIYVDDIVIAKQRVLARVEKGGHGVDEDVIERRAKTSLETLKLLVPMCDEVRVYDNTKAFTVVTRIINGSVKTFAQNIPAGVLACLEV